MDDHLEILAALQELPYPVGKRTLAEILTGAVTARMATSTIYMELEGYGTLRERDKASVEQLIERLVTNGYITMTSPVGKPHMRVLKLTQKGTQELRNPAFDASVLQPTFNADTTDEASKTLIANFSFFLTEYNDEQQHAIVSPAKKILCVAGAGTGKTTVLTKRIEFLVRYRGVAPRDILAITFTRKARAEMQARLAGLDVEITTFNGFCERFLRQHGYAKPLINYGQKIRLFRDVVDACAVSLHRLVEDCFTEVQRRGTTRDELERRLMGDVYSIIDHYANEDQEIPQRGVSSLADTLLRIARRIKAEIDTRGIRDYSGQLSDALALMRKNHTIIPCYAHVLVDEYQDVNVAQERLLDIMSPEHLFVVGDPRQSIFGWRGSQIRFITDFKAEKTIQLRTNYRSGPVIVGLMNRLIAGMRLPDLIASRGSGGSIQTLRYGSEDEELAAAAVLLEHAVHRDIFVLARTNRQLQDLSALLAQKGVAHSIKHEEDETQSEGIVLATVHAIKGLEASTVIVIGATSRYFPCKISDHPIVDLIKDAGLDREEEERRLLYVAVSRAKERLVITYTITQTYFFDGALSANAPILKKQTRSAPPFVKATSQGAHAFERLRTWRSRIARERWIPPYMICSDRSLQELVALSPTNVHELHDVHGLGEAKIRQYGTQLLAALHER